jgi:hypothetical protein
MAAMVAVVAVVAVVATVVNAADVVARDATAPVPMLLSMVVRGSC